MVWCGRPSFSTQFLELLHGVPLSDFDKEIIKSRYIDVVKNIEMDFRLNRLAFFILTNAITIAGVLITGLVSLDKLTFIDGRTAQGVFWTVWTLSIIVTLSNKWLYSFSIAKKYVTNATVLEKLYSEGWQFLAGIDKYKYCMTIDERFKLFCTRIEKLKLKSVENMTSTIDTDGGDALAGSPSDNGVDYSKQHQCEREGFVKKMIHKISPRAPTPPPSPVDDPTYVPPLKLPQTQRMPAAHMHAIRQPTMVSPYNPQSHHVSAASAAEQIP